MHKKYDFGNPQYDNDEIMKSYLLIVITSLNKKYDFGNPQYDTNETYLLIVIMSWQHPITGFSISERRALLCADDRIRGKGGRKPFFPFRYGTGLWQGKFMVR